jgi:hypothetical protein
MLKVLLLLTAALITIQSFRKPESDIEKIQKDPLFLNYMEFKSKNDFSNKYDFPIIANAQEKERKARANGTLNEYYKSIKDVNTGISWYDAVIVPRYTRLSFFGKVYKKYIVNGKMTVETLKLAESVYRENKRKSEQLK